MAKQYKVFGYYTTLAIVVAIIRGNWCVYYTGSAWDRYPVRFCTDLKRNFWTPII
jgi:hypothetical protein